MRTSKDSYMKIFQLHWLPFPDNGQKNITSPSYTQLLLIPAWTSSRCIKLEYSVSPPNVLSAWCDRHDHESQTQHVWLIATLMSLSVFLSFVFQCRHRLVVFHMYQYPDNSISTTATCQAYKSYFHFVSFCNVSKLPSTLWVKWRQIHKRRK